MVAVCLRGVFRRFGFPSAFIEDRPVPLKQDNIGVIAGEAYTCGVLPGQQRDQDIQRLAFLKQRNRNRRIGQEITGGLFLLWCHRRYDLQCGVLIAEDDAGRGRSPDAG
ncbi:hypothetical protein SDC9_87085 [bioreactor metagenome]|uniref:Uncharacterized protein n=1 Tax=bioreactor metagenome TaxID=1076179 RepID=A0A644ZS62_9ZZZZ